LANPAAPTGNVHPAQQIAELLEAAGDRWLVVLDAAYEQFSTSDALAFGRQPGLVVLKTLSKAAGLAGARIGYALSTPDTAEQLQKTLLPFSVSSLSAAAASVVMERQDWLAANVRQLIREREQLFQVMMGI